MKKGILTGKYLIIFESIKLILAIVFFVISRDNDWFEIVSFAFILCLLISFFYIYNPSPKHRIKFLWKIRLFLFGKPTNQ